MRASAALAAAALALALPGVARAQVEVKNDGFDSGDSVGFQAGFVSGEMAAVLLDPPAPGAQVLSVLLLFGPDASTPSTVTVHVWTDDGSTEPGTELFSGDFQLTGSSTAMHEVDLSTDNVVVPGSFRVGIEFQHNGAPSVARDDDGSIAGARNFILASGAGWFESQDLGLTGDWVIRAVVSGTPPTPDAGAGGGPDAGAGGDCVGNGDCVEGEYCDTSAGTCTFDCREDADCGGDMACNSLGQCVAADGGGSGGCCDAGGAPPPLGAIAGGVLLGLLVLRRRRA